MSKRCKNCGWPNDDSASKCQKCNAPLDSSTSAAPSRATTYDSPGGASSPSSGESLRKTVSENQFFGTDFSRGGGYHTDGNPLPRETVINGATAECPNCHYQVRRGVNTCPNCGYPISAGGAQPKAKTCPKCGAENSEAAKFCNSCGAPMDSAQQGSGNQPQSRTGTVNPWMHQNNNGAFCTLKPISWEGENINHEAIAFSGSVITLNRANTDPNNQSITSKEQAELTCENGEWYIIDKSAMHTTYVLASRKMKINKGDTIVLGNRLFEFN